MSDSNPDSTIRPVRNAGLLCREAASDAFRPVALSTDRCRIGRRFENDLIVSHASVSRFHAEIVQEGEHWYVIDCESKFGTSVNGERVVRAMLAAGDEIRIGTSDGPLIIFSPVDTSHPESLDDDDDYGDYAPTQPGQPADDLPIEAIVSDSHPNATKHAFEPSSTPSGDAIRLVEQFRATSLIGDYHEALLLVVDAALELTHYDRAALMLVDRAGAANGTLRLEVARTRSGRSVSADSGRETACVRAVVDSGRLVQIHPDVELSENEQEIARTAAASGIERIVCFPLLTETGGDFAGTAGAGPLTVGALYLEAGPGSIPVDGIRTVLESLASEAGQVVERLFARQFHSANARLQLASRVAERSARAGDQTLPLATRARAACELTNDLLMVGDLEGATVALKPFEDPEVRAQLPDSIRAEILKAIGIAMMWQGSWHRSVGLLNAALDGAVEGQGAVLEMTIRACLARCYTEIGEFALAREHVMTAVSVLRRLDDSSIDYARALLALGILEQYEGDLLSAMHAFRLALRVAAGTDDLLASASAHYRLGLLQAERGETSAAVASFQEALEVARPSGNTMLALVGQVALARALLRSGAWRRAQVVIATALETAIDDRHDRVRLQLHLLAAMIAVWRDDAETADRAVATAREQAETLEESEVLTEVDLLEVELCLDRRDPAAARRVLALASERVRDRGNTSHIARVHLLLSDVERMEGNTDAAHRHVGLAQRAITGQRDLHLAGLTQQAAGRVNAERRQLTEAQHHFAQALSIFRTLDDRRQVGRVHLDLGNLMLAANDPACARTHLQLARAIFADLGVASSLASVEASLARTVAGVSAEAPATYSSTVLSARSEPRFVRRLLEATQSRDLVLRELSSIAIDVARSTHASIVKCLPDGAIALTAASGDPELANLPALGFLKAARGEIVRTREVTIYPIEPLEADVADAASTLLVVNIELRENSRHDSMLQSIVQMAQQGLELVRLRASLKRADLPTLPTFDRSASGDRDAVGPAFIYVSSAMRELDERINRIRTSSTTVLITGESGVGKELVARAIHSVGPNAARPFVPFNCSAAPRELVESQIFGYRKGAFTGATTDSAGVARAARGGTLFLDEIGDLPLEIQPKLLRFLEYGEIQPLGEATPLHVNVRLVAATNADLEKAVSERRFREDLFHRLNIIRLHVPPLRERAEDIPLLVAHFLQELASRAGIERAPAISEEALATIVRFPWPGNVRQLRNEVERLVTFHEEGSTITREQLSPELLEFHGNGSSGSGQPTAQRPYDPMSIPLAERLDLFETEQITRALSESSMNMTRAAASLGMARQNLQRRIRKLGLKVQISEQD